MIWDRSSKEEYDNLVTLGNPGWDFNSLLTYFKKSESFVPPADQEFADFWNQTFIPSFRGTGGPVSTVFPNFLPEAEFPQDQAALNLRIPVVHEPMGGQTSGAWRGSASIDFTTRTRSYSTTAYYLPNQNRTNLVLVTGAQVTNIHWAPTKKSGLVVASGVSFVMGNSTQAHTVNASAEVVLCSGSIGSPQILELSGIGDKTRLGKLDIKSVVNLPEVGENLQDHIFVTSVSGLTLH